MRHFLIVLLLFSSSTFGQIENAFQSAYAVNPFVPSGLLEAVAFTNTHMREISESDAPSCTGIPRPFGIMGLFENGEGYFRENGKIVAHHSGISISTQKSGVEFQILAYAKAFNTLMQDISVNPADKNDPIKIYSILQLLTEIPDSGMVNLFARDLQICEVLKFMNSTEKANLYQFQVHQFDLSDVFGEVNFKVLSSNRISISHEGITTDKNENYTVSTLKSIEYGPAIWNPAPACNISSRSGTPISAITIHTIQGTYAGAISWSQNCASSVSYHYVVRSSDGQITQMVQEADKAWHVGSENPYTIGYEHEGYVSDPSWYTEELYQASADLSKDVINSGYGIPALRTYFGPSSASGQVLGGCTKIKGHQHFPNQTHTDPGIYWNWEKYYRLINDNPTITSITSTSGSFYDSGGNSADYQDDERSLWLFQPTNATSITMTFTSFSLENNYDYLFIYDGNTINSPLLGTYTSTNSPGTITSSGSALLFEFRSDCSTTASGWAATFTSTLADTEAPLSTITPSSTWQTQNFDVDFVDSDNLGIAESFYLVADKDAGQIGWKSNGDNGFVNEDLSDNDDSWTQQTGSFNLSAGKYLFSDIAQNNSNAYTDVVQNNGSSYLYQWKQNITSTGSNQRAGLHFFCSDPTLPNRGESYFVYFRQGQNKVQIYSVTNDIYSMETNDTCIVDANTEYVYSVWYDPSTGWIKVFVNTELVSSWQDASPLISGNSISLRSGGCAVSFDDIQCYKSRTTNETINLQSDFRYESVNSTVAGRINSKVIDQSDNWSTEDSEEYLVDWTIPQVDLIFDGTANDIDTNYTTTLNCNWQGTDPNSGITGYEVAIGTSPLSDDVVSWNPNGLSETFSHVLSSPVYDQIYYISTRATNAAGLINEVSSDGQRLLDGSSYLAENLLNSISVYPNPATDVLHLMNLPFPIEVFLYSSDGKIVYKGKAESELTLDLKLLAAGNYQLVLSKNDQFIVKKIVVASE